MFYQSDPESSVDNGLKLHCCLGCLIDQCKEGNALTFIGDDRVESIDTTIGSAALLDDP